MITNNIKIKSRTVVSISVLIALAGCSSTHTAKWNETGREIDKDTEAFENSQANVIPEERQLTSIIDEFYVDTSPVVIIKESKTSLPGVFYKKMNFFSKKRITLKALAGEIYLATGLSIDYVNNEKKIEDVDKKGLLAGDDKKKEEYRPEYFNPENMKDMESLLEEDEKPEETIDTIYIDHSGSLKELLDYIAVKKGFKWKYDQLSNKIFVYKFDTRTFTIIGFGEKMEKENSITTQMSSSNDSDNDNGGSSTDNEQSITISSKSNYWENIKESITTVISDKGTVTFNSVQGKIIVTDNDFILAKVNAIIDDLNKDAFREIALSVQVINITITDKRNINASINIQNINNKFNLNFGNAIDIINPAKNSISFTDGKTSAMLSMLDTIGKTTVENRIDVVTLNNMPVPIQLTQNRSYIKEISVEDDGDNGDETTEVEVGIVSEGITMTLTPKAIGQNILLDYSLNLSAIDDIENAPGDIQVQLPITSTKNFVQRTSLRNGVPRVLATVERLLISNSSEHPMNENLWFLGGSEGISNKRDILMVIVTPYITDLIK